MSTDAGKTVFGRQARTSFGNLTCDAYSEVQGTCSSADKWNGGRLSQHAKGPDLTSRMGRGE